MPLPDWSERRTSFGSAATAYALGRPTYPLDALRWIMPAGASRVLDLAAGTGKLTERLIEMRLDVVAVEPLAEMRAEIPAGADVLDGSAEQIPIADGSVDALLVWQAYHWFEPARALPEMHRVLRPGGRIGLLWNMLDDSDDWVRALADVIDAEERASLISTEPRPVIASVSGFTDAQRRLFPHTLRYDAERLEAFIVSRSQAILMPDEERREMLRRVRELAPADECDLPFVCETWRSDRL
jgi:SAM-dependent methyltransferase